VLFTGNVKVFPFPVLCYPVISFYFQSASDYNMLVSFDYFLQYVRCSMKF